MSIKAVVVKTKKRKCTSLRYNHPNGTWRYLYVERLDAKPGDQVTIIIEQDEP